MNLKTRRSYDLGSSITRYLPPQQIEGATVFMSGNGRDIRELSLDEIGENYNANDLCSLSKHLLQSPIDMAYNINTHQLFVVRTDGVIALLKQNASLGISAWGTYKTDGKFLSVCVCDNKTYVVVQRSDNIYLEYFDSMEMYDCDTHSYSFTASSLPFRSRR